MEEVVNALGLEDQVQLSMAAVAGKVEENQGSIDLELGPEKSTKFRAVAARLN